MNYQLTQYSNVTNTGSLCKITLFDTWNELQDYIEDEALKLPEDERELFYSYLVIKPLNDLTASR